LELDIISQRGHRRYNQDIEEYALEEISIIGCIYGNEEKIFQELTDIYIYQYLLYNITVLTLIVRLLREEGIDVSIRFKKQIAYL
jgi:hypothetical protein